MTHSLLKAGWIVDILTNSGLNLYHAQKDIENVPLWGQTLGRAGYNTWVTGKWHNGPRTLAKSFKSGESIGNAMYGAKDQYNRPRPGGVDWKPWDKSKGGHWKPNVADFDPTVRNPSKCLTNRHDVARHTTDLYADNAIRFLKNNAAKIDAMVYLHTLFPTTCDLAGVDIPETVESKSLVPLLNGKKTKINDAIYGSYKSFQRMVRTQDYKLIIYPIAQQVQLFDMKNDPWEKNNLADDPKYAPKIKQLRAKLKELQKEVGDTLDLDNPPIPKKQKKQPGKDV